MRKKILKIGFIVFFLLLVIISLGVTFLEEKKYNDKRKKIENIILNYLEDKYNEKFEIKEYVFEKNTYNHATENDYVTSTMESSYIYTVSVVSSRLVEFDVMYVDYDDLEYDKYKKYNILREGIYENYIYEYKIKDIRKEIKDKLNKYIDNIESFEVSISDLSIDSTNYIYSYSLDKDDEIDAFNNYSKMDKRVSNKDFYDTCLKVSSGSKFYLDIKVNERIDKSNVESFNKSLIKLVNYFYELGYKEYDINFVFNNYVSGRATPYKDDSKIYFIFDYESYSNIENSEKLGLYVLDR